MNLRQIEMFRAIMQTGSFTAAADLLHISQPGVSRAARHLESQLGVALFERVHGRIRPTSAALALHDEIERSYRGVKAIQQFARRLKDGTHRMLRAGSSANLVAEVVPAAVTELLETNAEAVISLEVVMRLPQMIDGLISRQLDVMVSAVAVEHPLLESKALGEWSLACVFPKGHALEQRDVIDVADLEGESIVLFHDDTLQGGVVSGWLHDVPGVQVSRAVVRSGQTACSLVCNGQGVTIVDDLTARAAAAQGLSWRPMRRSPRFPVYLVWHQALGLPLQGERLGEIVTRRLAELALAG